MCGRTVIHLKSSMERFIADVFNLIPKLNLVFKIQYGEIYSFTDLRTEEEKQKFKIQYGEIYRRVLLFVIFCF